MCGRYSFAPKPKQCEVLPKAVKVSPQFQIGFNIAPTHAAYVIANDLPDGLQRME